MTVEEMEIFLYRLVQESAPAEKVIWTERYDPELPLPLTTLKIKDVETSWNPVEIVVDGNIRSYYNCKFILEVSKYAGRINAEDKVMDGERNAAVEGMLQLLLHLRSDSVVRKMYKANIYITLMEEREGQAQMGEGHYRYHAIKEFKVKCMVECKEGEWSLYAPDINGVLPETENEPIGYFEEVEMEDLYE